MINVGEHGFETLKLSSNDYLNVYKSNIIMIVIIIQIYKVRKMSTQNISPQTRNRTNLLSTQQQSQLYQPRVKNPLKRISQTVTSIEDEPAEVMRTTELNKYT